MDTPSSKLRSGIEIIAHERGRHRFAEDWSHEHDDNHVHGELATAAACYALPDRSRSALLLLWPWAREWWKPTPSDRIRELAKAGALIAAEIDRLLRAEEKANPPPFGGRPHE